MAPFPLICRSFTVLEDMAKQRLPAAKLQTPEVSSITTRLPACLLTRNELASHHRSQPRDPGHPLTTSGPSTTPHSCSLPTPTFPTAFKALRHSDITPGMYLHLTAQPPSSRGRGRIVKGNYRPIQPHRPWRKIAEVYRHARQSSFLTHNVLPIETLAKI